MSSCIILQARTGSSRLPDKMLMPFHQDKGILEILLERIKKDIPLPIDQLVVATTVNPGDDRIEELCNRIGISCYRGSESDVLSRFIEAAKKYNADRVIRVCADNVFLDTKALNDLLRKLDSSQDDYVSYCTSDGTPSIKTHYGFWAEGVSLSALEKVNQTTSESLYHEHVTNYIYSHPDYFSIKLQNIDETIPGIENHKNLRLTIDTIEDFNTSQEIYGYLINNNLPATAENIIAYLEGHPELYVRMKEVISKNQK